MGAARKKAKKEEQETVTTAARKKAKKEEQETVTTAARRMVIVITAAKRPGRRGITAARRPARRASITRAVIITITTITRVEAARRVVIEAKNVLKLTLM